MPLILAPVGLLGMQHGDGEIHACRAAQAAGIPFTQSTMSICSIEDIAAAVDKPFWFQLYVMKDRGFIKALIERAIAAKCSALVLTVDLQVIGQRHQDIKNGMTVPPEWSLSKLIDFATKPAWVSGVLRGKRRTFGNLAGHLKGSDDITSLSTWIDSQFDTSLNWKDIDWIRSIWPGKLILKGILDVEDAEIAAKTGAQAIVVSNHGGRQLDGAPSSIEVLPEIVDAVGSKMEIMFDGGIRSGQDVMRALALGAKSCMIGRAYAYGLGAGGEAGVAKAIDIIAQRAHHDDGTVRRQHHRRDRRSRAGGLSRMRSQSAAARSAVAIVPANSDDSGTDASTAHPRTCASAPHIGGVIPSRPTLTRLASSVPSSFFAAPKMMILAPGFSSDLSPATKVTIGVPGGTTTFFSPSLYLTRMFWPSVPFTVCGDGGVGHGASWRADPRDENLRPRRAGSPGRCAPRPPSGCRRAPAWR